MTARSGRRAGLGRIVGVGVILAGGLLAVPGPASGAEPSQITERAYWHMEQPEGGVVPDLEGGLGLSLRGDASVYSPDDTCDPFTDPTCEPAPVALWGDGHLELTGTGGYADRVPGLLPAKTGFTVTARARLHSSPATQDQTVFSLPGTTRTAALVRYDADSVRWQLELTDEDDADATTAQAVAVGPMPSAAGDGDHLALVYDAHLREVRLYVDGQLAAGATTRWHHHWDFSTVGVQVGRTGTGPSGSEFFDGAIDEVRVFDGALSGNQISTVSMLQSGVTYMS